MAIVRIIYSEFRQHCSLLVLSVFLFPAKESSETRWEGGALQDNGEVMEGVRTPVAQVTDPDMESTAGELYPSGARFVISSVISQVY